MPSVLKRIDDRIDKAYADLDKEYIFLDNRINNAKARRKDKIRPIVTGVSKCYNVFHIHPHMRETRQYIN